MLGNALIIAGDGAKFAAAASIALAFEAAVDAPPEKRKELVSAASALIPRALEAVGTRFPADVVSMLSRNLTRAIKDFSQYNTQKRQKEKP